jgi:formiminoglutamase
MGMFSSINADYVSAEKLYWQGRKSNPDVGIQYWHQKIEFKDLNNLEKESSCHQHFSILGYVCDEGVRRNRGRVGASEGPKAIRDRLAKLPVHFEEKYVSDYGDVICVDEDMEACQDLFALGIERILGLGHFPIAIGGGHDMALAHYMGIFNHLSGLKNKKIAIINFDAHFDLRPVEGRANSGTPFNQVIEHACQNKIDLEYFVIGIQQQSNTKELFNISEQKHIHYALNYDCESSKEELSALKERLEPILEKNDYIFVTVDLDGFSSAYAPGVSAPSPLGFTPFFVFKMMQYIMQSNKLISFEIAELNPLLDRDMHTANLAAKLIDFFVSHK